MFHMRATILALTERNVPQQIFISGICSCDEQETICGQKVMGTCFRAFLRCITLPFKLAGFFFQAWEA